MDFDRLVQQAAGALAIWDAWCPDDGRPAHALYILQQYWRGIADADEVQRVLAACAAAGGTCYPGDAAIRACTDSRARAWWVVWGLLGLGSGFRNASGVHAWTRDAWTRLGLL